LRSRRTSLLYTWGLAKEALPFLRYLAEHYPDSIQAQAMLADGYVQLEDYVSAIGVLSTFVDQHPDNPPARGWSSCAYFRTHHESDAMSVATDFRRALTWGALPPY
jgi:tetratricopeptide (TPR) repeat protein